LQYITVRELSFSYLNILVSFANLKTLLLISSSKSFINIKNSRGLSTEPCGTPLQTAKHRSIICVSYRVRVLVQCVGPYVFKNNVHLL